MVSLLRRHAQAPCVVVNPLRAPLRGLHAPPNFFLLYDESTQAAWRPQGCDWSNPSLFTLWVVAYIRYLAQTPCKSPQTYFSVTITGFLHCSVYFSVNKKKSKQNKVKQTTFMYKYDHLRSLVRHLFFYCFATPTN